MGAEKNLKDFAIDTSIGFAFGKLGNLSDNNISSIVQKGSAHFNFGAGLSRCGLAGASTAISLTAKDSLD